RVLEQTERWFREYRFDLIAAAMHEFVWHDFCDWYLEITKIIQDDGGGDGGDGSANGGGDSARANRACLMDTLEACLRMLHPVIPFITAEIWQQIKPLTGHDEADIQQRPYPLCGDVARDAEAERTMARLQSFVSAIRQVRSEMNVPPGRAVPVLLQNWGDADRALFDDCGGWIARLAGIGQLEWLAADSEAPPAAIALAGQVKILIPAEGLIDIEAETLRLKKEIAKTEKTLAGMRTRLADRNFLDKAPADVIEKQSLQAEHLEGQLDKYHKQLQVFSNTGGQPEQRGAVV
ncbi:MAG: class I tRNA ligase family protein, partial [Gammaproteobacteria bacterium]|nr:class I tRNA ligase family protein [Gammaproteobacteria bacterium]